MEWVWAVLGIAVAVTLLLWLSWTANRLDRMHHRIDVARASLDTHLLRRSGAALELATSGTLDPARSLLLVDAASEARAARTTSSPPSRTCPRRCGPSWPTRTRFTRSGRTRRSGRC